MTEKQSKIVWQTYRNFEELPIESEICTHSWRTLNPDWNIHFCSDADLALFFSSCQDVDLQNLFKSFPSGAMRGCLWSYAVLYEYGGVYAELDTVCYSPIETWLTSPEKLHLSCTADGEEFSQAIIAAPAKHPLLRMVLDEIKKRATSSINLDLPNYFHYYVGRDPWTAAVKNYLQRDGNAREISREATKDALNLTLHNERFFNGDKARHLNASYNWTGMGTSYLSWRNHVT